MEWHIGGICFYSTLNLVLGSPQRFINLPRAFRKRERWQCINCNHQWKVHIYKLIRTGTILHIMIAFHRLIVMRYWCYQYKQRKYLMWWTVYNVILSFLKPYKEVKLIWEQFFLACRLFPWKFIKLHPKAKTKD